MALPFEVLILGSGSAIPNRHKNHTSQLVIYNNKHFLFDCGEGTQSRIRKYGCSVQKIDHIFISHLHGDHYLGLAGLVSSMTLFGREKILNIYGPERIKEVIDLHFGLANSRPSFEINYVFTQDKVVKELYADSHISISSFPVKHKIPTTGFLVEAGSKKRKLIPEMLQKHAIPRHLRSGIAEGKDYVSPEGKKIANEELTEDPEKRRTYAFCADTKFLPGLAEVIQNVNMFYHEASFLQEDQKRAKEHLHSTAAQAAELAKLSGAGKLLIGHFSNKYQDDEAFLREAREVFEETYIAIEGERYEIN